MKIFFAGTLSSKVFEWNDRRFYAVSCRECMLLCAHDSKMDAFSDYARRFAKYPQRFMPYLARKFG